MFNHLDSPTCFYVVNSEVMVYEHRFYIRLYRTKSINLDMHLLCDWIVCFLSKFQFQTLRSMVQTNPQILQVCNLSYIYILMILYVIWLFAAAIIIAHAAGAWKTKSPAFEINSGAPCGVPSVNKWTPRGVWRVSFFSLFVVSVLI